MNKRKTTEIKKHFSERSKKYDELGTWVNNNLILSTIISYLPTSTKEDINIIDLGAGTGAVSKHIFKEYKCEKTITAVDLCSDMLSKITEPDIKKYITSIEQMPFSNDVFDVVVTRQCLHYVDDLNCTIKEIKRIMKNKGTFILAQIVPLDDSSKGYWSKVIEFRQPLRKHFLSEKDWVNAFSDEGFVLLDVSQFSHQGSVMKWAEKYNINDTNIINKYKKLLLDAPNKFIDNYNVKETKDDVFYDTFWMVAKFIIDK